MRATHVIQVYLGDKLVGALENPPFDMKRIPSEFPILPPTMSIARFGADVAEIEDQVWIQTAARGCRIGEEEMEDLHKVTAGAVPGGSDPSFTPAFVFAQHFGIPSYAERIRRPDTMQIQFRWHVAVPTLLQYEKMFDLDNFKPL